MIKEPVLKVIGVFLLMLTVVVFAFGSSVTNEFVTWDDALLITENPIVTEPSIAHVIKAFSSYDPELYIPLTLVSYQANTLVCGLHPSCFHATDLLLHTINATLVFFLLSALLGSEFIALLLALLFAVHPLNTEAVVWASARKDTLSTVFFLSAYISYIRSRRHDVRNRWICLSLGLFVLGLLSKVSVAVLPIVLILTDALERRNDYRRLIAEKIPFILLAIIFGIVALIGKQNVLEVTTLFEKFLMAGRSILYYLTAFIAPYNLSVMVPYSGSISVSLPAFYIPIIVLPVVAVLTLLLRKKYPWILFGVFFFFVTLAPTFTNFAKGGDLYIASDRYAYIPMIGLLFLLGSLLEAWLARTTSDRGYTSRKKAIQISSLVVLAFCIAISFTQTKTWQNSSTLYEHTLSVYPHARAGLANLGMERLRSRNYAEAVSLFDLSLQLKNDPIVRADRASALLESGDIVTAESEYKKILLADPTLAEAYYNLGNISRRKGDLSTAVTYYIEALARDPFYFNALNNLSAVYVSQKNWASALTTYQTILLAHPRDTDALYNAGLASMMLGHFSESRDYFQQFISQHPTDSSAHAMLATALYEMGSIDDSATALMTALQFDSSNPDALTLVRRMQKDGYAK